MSAAHTQEGFPGQIEGLRGVAVLGALAFHAGVPGWAAGFAASMSSECDPGLPDHQSDAA